jgi:hypothetical protein
MGKVKFLQVIIYIVSTVLVFSHCTVTNRQFDSKPPVLSWTIKDKSTGISTNIDNDSPYTLTRGHNYDITLVADNPGGIKHISIEGAAECQCKLGTQTGSQQLYQLSFPLKEENFYKVRKIQSDRVANLSYTFNHIDGEPCGNKSNSSEGNDAVVSGAKVVFVGKAGNFSDVASTQVLTLFLQ